MHIFFQKLPNTITLFRIVIAPCIVVAASTPEFTYMGQILILIGVVSDKIDGTLARYLHVESVAGKKLESIADPIFALATTYYILIHTDFPHHLFWYGIILFMLSTAPRTLWYIRSRRLFFEKSEITRILTALLFITMLMYVFNIPLRLPVAYITAAWGALTCANYLRMQYRYVYKS